MPSPRIRVTTKPRPHAPANLVTWRISAGFHMCQFLKLQSRALTTEDTEEHRGKAESKPVLFQLCVPLCPLWLEGFYAPDSRTTRSRHSRGQRVDADTVPSQGFGQARRRGLRHVPAGGLSGGRHSAQRFSAAGLLGAMASPPV